MGSATVLIELLMGTTETRQVLCRPLQVALFIDIYRYREA